jgi:hypothetical protein
MKRILLAALIGIFLVINTVSSQSMNFSVSPESLWLGDYTDLACVTDGVTGPVYAEITSPLYTRLPMAANESYYSYQYIPQILGTFEAYCTNDSVSSGAVSFNVSSLVLETSCPSVYSDEEVHLRARVFKKTSVLEEIKASGLEFRLYLDGTQVYTSAPYYLDDWHIDTVNASLSGRNYTLRLEAIYTGKSNYTETALEVKPALEFSVTGINPSSVRGGENMTANLLAEYHDANILSSANINVTINGQAVDFIRTTTGLTFQTPPLSPGTYGLVINLGRGSLSRTETRQLDYVIPVHGEVKDADNKGVTGTLKFSKTSYTKVISVTNGVYSDTVPAGTYEVEATFTKFRARFTGVPITSEVANLLRFDSFQNTMGGLRVVGGYALEFSQPFQRVYIEAEYDAQKITDETELEVYKCGNWNIDARKCNGNWARIASDVNAVSNKASFEVDSLSGFVLGEMSELAVSAAIDRSEYYFGQAIKLSGVVKDKNNNVVPDAVVTYYIGSLTGTLTSDGGGLFSADITVPRSEGKSVMIINASKTFYQPAGALMELTILKRNELGLVFPESPEVKEGETSEIEIKLSNSGDTTLTDVKVTLSGLPGGSDYSPKTISSLLSGEEKTVKILLNPGPEDKKVYTVTVSLAASEASYSDSFVLTVKRAIVQNNVNETENQTLTTRVPDFSAITAYFAANGTAIMNLGSVAASALVIIFLGIRAGSGRGRNPMARSSILSVLEAIKKEVIWVPRKAVKAIRRHKKPRAKVKAEPKPTEQKEGQAQGQKPKQEEPEENPEHLIGVG